MNYHRNDPESSQFGNKTKKNVTNKPKIPMGNFRNATSTNDVPTFRSVPMFEPLRPGKLQTIPTIEKPHMLRSQSTETTAAFTCDSLCSEQNFFFSDFSWDVKFSVDELPPLPMYVDVKFCVSVEATPSAIAGRIERLLYELSAVPKYSCDETKSLSLWRFRNAEGVGGVFMKRPRAYLSLLRSHKAQRIRHQFT
mmetsp:Transcript_36187/g.41985  ORF Transcript_36187/g.41985 Transcript_36187/m.41985 type:complete len:195 (-) Transcript_36187:813-1397(-)